jgi:hypothetical protein
MALGVGWMLPRSLGRPLVEIASLSQPTQGAVADARHELLEGVAARRRRLVHADAVAAALEGGIQRGVMEVNMNV